MFSSKYLIFDAIFGRANKLTRQRLSWRTPGMSVVQARVQADEDYPGEDVKPTTMLAIAGMDLENTLALLRAIALTAVASAVIDRNALGTGFFDAGNLDKRSAA